MRMAGDGRDHTHALSLREFRMHARIPVLWDGTSSTLCFRHHHQDVPVNDRAMARLEQAGVLADEELQRIRPLRGDVFIGSHRVWFYHLPVEGKLPEVAARIEHCLSERPTRIELWKIDLDEIPLKLWSYLTSETLADHLLLKMAL
jgi:hypothetical protein